MTDLFCSIIAGDVPAETVHRDEHTIAFLDHRPLFKGHTLVCPVRHVDTLLDLEPAAMPALFGTAQRIAAALGDALGCQGTFVAMNNVVSQSIPHLHVHVVPRTKGDGLRGFFWPRTKYADGEAAEYAARIRAAVQR
ncbi:HIT family protein [Naumannella halotolerans]|uniref:Histidine triad (HIT) family protein n=1 Tax=Naumannella halotolerans TaxID=993414 RepID=A0A4R7JA42_9ACTN|nr:HIT family protein [Naumannella halotolerans]TDT33249.1 histidine triad (HIT) family protein [Naumannella halotolerans]